MSATLKIALIQADLAWEDASANRQHLDTLIAQASGSDLIVLPEMFSTGFHMHPVGLAEDMKGPTVQWMTELSAKYGCVITGSLIIREDGSYLNRLIWANNGRVEGFYDKRHLFRMAGEHHAYTGGSDKTIFQLKGWRVFPLICYDLRFPVWSRNANTFDLMLYVANWPDVRRNAWNRLLPARAIENQCYVAGVNRVGTDGNNNAYSGDSVIIDPLGDYLSKPGDTSERIISAELNLKTLDDLRKRFPVHLDADQFSIAEKVVGAAIPAQDPS